MNNARLIAFHLPQYHPISENDEWWGKGFTEWTNTAKAFPLFRSHYQPHIPADLGYYDLRLPEARLAQAELAKEYGIEGFCYYHYWFGGKQLLERPVKEIINSGKPDFPFCLCWANATWTGIWHGAPNRVLIEQTYPGVSDHEKHFQYLLKAFQDKRYIKIDGKPLFIVYKPKDLPDIEKIGILWRKMAAKTGLPGLFLVGVNHNDNWNPNDAGFDAAIMQRIPVKIKKIPWRHLNLKLSQMYQNTQLTIYDYEETMDSFIRDGATNYLAFPVAIPNWDNTPRSGMNGLILHNSTPELFCQHFRKTLDKVKDNPTDKKIVFIKSWNEWAEGNHLEPDLQFGRAYLEVIRDELFATNTR